MAAVSVGEERTQLDGSHERVLVDLLHDTVAAVDFDSGHQVPRGVGRMEKPLPHRLGREHAVAVALGDRLERRHEAMPLPEIAHIVRSDVPAVSQGSVPA